MRFTVKRIIRQLNRASRYVPLVRSRAAGAPGKSKVWEVNRPGTERQTPPLQAAVGRAVGNEVQTGIMILALATRHRVERPAISMEGGTVFSYGAARPPPSGIAFEQIRDKKRSAQCKVRILSFIEKIFVQVLKGEILSWTGNILYKITYD